MVLLDWAEPWSWARQVRDWIRFLKGITTTWDDDRKIAAEETMKDWQQRKRGASHGGGVSISSETAVNIPLGQGEWDEPLGLPICVACHGVCSPHESSKDRY